MSMAFKVKKLGQRRFFKLLTCANINSALLFGTYIAFISNFNGLLLPKVRYRVYCTSRMCRCHERPWLNADDQPGMRQDCYDSFAMSFSLKVKSVSIHHASHSTVFFWSSSLKQCPVFSCVSSLYSRLQSTSSLSYILVFLHAPWISFDRQKFFFLIWFPPRPAVAF